MILTGRKHIAFDRSPEPDRGAFLPENRTAISSLRRSFASRPHHNPD